MENILVSEKNLTDKHSLEIKIRKFKRKEKIIRTSYKNKTIITNENKIQYALYECMCNTALHSKIAH